MDILQIIGIILAVVVTLWSLYLYYTANFDYWEKKGINFVLTNKILDTIPPVFGKEAHLLEAKRVAKYGRVFGYFEGRNPALTLTDPDLIRNILVKDFPSFTGRRDFRIGDEIFDKNVSVVQGETWKRIRSIISPTFSTGKIKRTTSIFMDSADTLCKNFDKCISQKEDIDAKRLFGTYAMDVIASSAFGTKIDSHNDPNNRFVTEARNMFEPKFPIRFILLFLFPKVARFFRISVFPPSSIDFFKDVTFKIIEERKRTGQARNDFLQLMLDASSEESNKENQNGNEPKSDFKSLSKNELLAQCIVFFLAGFDGIASTLAITCYLLALNKECQEKVIKEIDDMIAENKGEMTYEGIQSMKYLDNVLSETLRMYPPGFRVERVADEDYVLGDTGITIPKGMLVGIPVYAMHHDPEFFPDPEKFDPDRFTAEGKASRHQYAYLPFSHGPRNCVAMRFAQMKVKICLAKVFSRFRMKTSPNTKIPLHVRTTGGILQPTENILLTVEKRTDIP